MFDTMLKYLRKTGIWKWQWGKKVRERLRLMYYAFLRPAVGPPKTRYSYQQPFIQHEFSAGERVLDVGSGGDPFPFASVLADRYLQPTRHRGAEFQSHSKPVVVCDLHALPVADRQFDYVVCAHVLEHIDHPIQACSELQRVAFAGFIETPSFLNDALFAWAKNMHKWRIIAVANRLVFFEYSERQLEGIRRGAWRRVIFGPTYHPLQEAFNANQDLFNTILNWEGGFDCTVYYLNGQVEHRALT